MALLCVIICTFVLVKQRKLPGTCGFAVRHYLHFCTSKARKLPSTCGFAVRATIYGVDADQTGMREHT